MVNLGDVFPDFEAQTNQGKIKFHEFLGNRYVRNVHIFIEHAKLQRESSLESYTKLQLYHCILMRSW